MDVRPARGGYAAHALAALRYGKGEDAPRLRGQHGRDELARVILGIGGGQPVAQVAQYMGVIEEPRQGGRVARLPWADYILHVVASLCLYCIFNLQTWLPVKS